MPLKVCAEPGCPSPATYRGRCQAHSTQRDRSINRAGRKLYGTKRWQMTRRRKLSETPLCEECGALADTVHHITDLADGGDPYAMDNLSAVCHSCHSTITRARQAA